MKRADFLEELSLMLDDFIERFEGFADGFTHSVATSYSKSEHTLKEAYLKSEENIKKFNRMILELNGSVSRCRALFDGQKQHTPRWYMLKDVSPPERGEIWVKDIDGTETLAKCEGRAIIYPASSSMKSPEFWRPS